MKSLKKYFKGVLLKGALVLGLVSCSSDFLDINIDPNNPPTASLDFLLTTGQLSGCFSANRIVMEHSATFVQHFYSLAASTFNITGSNYGNDFSAIYAVSLKDLHTVQMQAAESSFNGYVGIAKVMKAYLFLTLTDYFGDIPYSEALQGESLTKTPKYDNAASVYDQLIVLLGEAKADLAAAIAANEGKVNGDLIHGGAATATLQYGRWIKAANTLLLRLYLNIRKVDAARATSGINALITENNMISSNADDFQLVYGNSQAPQNRHPLFQQEYSGAGKTFYMTNYFMYHMIRKADPRLPFYIFRQGNDANITADAQVRPCRFRTDCVYGWLSVDPQTKGLAALPAGSANGYIGRDGGDPSGIPGDQAVRSTFGVYPIAGSYDRGPGGGARTLASGATGAGVFPMMTNFMRAFMLSEAALTLGTAGDPKTLMMEGIDASLAKVEAFGRAADPVAPAMTDAAKSGYKTTVGNAYDAAGNDDERLNVIISEKYYANFGNGLEPYTDFRRTGKPANLPGALAATGPYPRRLLLPPTELTSNPNAPNPPPLATDRIFWDVE